MLAGSVALLGMIVMLGWLAHVPALVRILPGLAAMTFGTALCFLLIGAALLSLDYTTRRAGQLRSVLAAALLLIAGAMLVEQVSGVDLGVDLTSVHAWLDPDDPTAGRMSPNTALAFFLSGVGVLTLRRTSHGLSSYAPPVLSWCVIAIGAAAIAGYVLGAQYLYRWYGFATMALHTAVGLTFTGTALYLAWRDRPWHAERVAARPDAHIAAVAAGWLAAIALAAGIAGFVAMQQRAEENLENTLAVALRNRIELFESLIALRASNTTLIATRPAMLMHLRRLVDHPDDIAARTAIATIAASFLPGGFSAVAIRDLHDREVARAGRFAENPDLALPIDVEHHAELVWKGGFMLRTRVELVDGEGPVGMAIAEQPLPILTRTVDDVASLGESGDAGMCGRRGDEMQCFPQRLRREVFAVPITKRTQSLPIVLALDGQSGVTRGLDYRDKTVVAAYGPVGRTGIGMSLKVDAAEVYQPVRDRMALFAPLLLVLVFAGSTVLRSQIKPLVAELVRSRETLRARSAEIAQTNVELKRALETRDRFLATMSHELRTPLNAIIGFSGTMLMKMPGPLNSEQERQLGIVATNGKHLLSLINDMLDVAQIDAGKITLKREPQVVQDVLDHVVETLAPLAEHKSLRLSVKAPAEEVSIHTDRRALLQILMNLVGNAIKYAHAGSVSIELAQRTHGSDSMTEIAVTDTGVGIKEEDQARLFKAFERVGDLRSRPDSTGLGLYLSRRLAELIGGTITLRSEFGVGSTFILSLPTTERVGAVAIDR